MYSISELQAYIRVLDMNEHRPVFLKPLYEVRNEEDLVEFYLSIKFRVVGVLYLKGQSSDIIRGMSEM